MKTSTLDKLQVLMGCVTGCFCGRFQSQNMMLTNSLIEPFIPRHTTSLPLFLAKRARNSKMENAARDRGFGKLVEGVRATPPHCLQYAAGVCRTTVRPFGAQLLACVRALRDRPMIHHDLQALYSLTCCAGFSPSSSS